MIFQAAFVINTTRACKYTASLYNDHDSTRLSQAKNRHYVSVYYFLLICLRVN